VGSASCDDPKHAELLAAVERLIADNRQQAEQIEALTKRCDAQDREIADLKAKVGRNSSNSSQPPSSDPPFAKMKRTRTPSGRKQGGQPGHPGSTRDLIDPKDVDRFAPHWPETCSCGCALPQVPDGDPVRVQVWELPVIRPEVTEHQMHAVVCPRCGRRTVAARTPDMPKGSFGPRAEAAVLYVQGACRLSARETKRLFEDLLDFPISTGALMRIASRGSTALAPAHADALAAVRAAGVKHADETAWFLRGDLVWLWLAATQALRVFRVDPRRTVQAREAFLGVTIDGVLVSDRFSAYTAQPGDRHQFCLAHLARDAQALIDRGGRATPFGTKLKSAIDALFKEWRDFEDVHHDRALLRGRVQPTREAITDLLVAGADDRDDRVAEFSAHLLMKGESIFTFTEVEGCVPTNNLAEQSMRKPVMWRRSSLGSQSEWGCRFVERILTAVESLRAQGRDVLAFLVETMSAAALGRAPPSLVPVPTPAAARSRLAS
jgi:transposase